MEETGTSRSAEGGAPAAVAVASGGISAPSPLPSPLRRATAHLLGQLAVGNGATRGRIERNDRLAVGRGLREPDRAGHDVATHLVAEVVPHLLHHLVGELRAGVVHHADDGRDLETGVEVL